MGHTIAMTKRLEYLRYSEYGLWNGKKGRQHRANDPLVALEPIDTDKSHCTALVIDRIFRISPRHPISLIYLQGHRNSLHAEFTLVDLCTPVACFYPPVVERLWWEGEELRIYTHSTPDLLRRIEWAQKRRAGRWPQTTELMPESS